MLKSYLPDCNTTQLDKLMILLFLSIISPEFCGLACSTLLRVVIFWPDRSWVLLAMIEHCLNISDIYTNVSSNSHLWYKVWALG